MEADQNMEKILEEYSGSLDLLDAYDHQTLTLPKGKYYNGYETVEEVAADLLYTMIKEKDICDGNIRIAATRFLIFLEWNNALIIDGKKRIADSTLIALAILIAKSREDEKEMIIKLVVNCMG